MKLDGAVINLSYFKNSNLDNVKTSLTTKTDSCFGDNVLDRILCYLFRTITPDTPPFYGKYQYTGRL